VELDQENFRRIFPISVSHTLFLLEFLTATFWTDLSELYEKVAEKENTEK